MQKIIVILVIKCEPFEISGQWSYSGASKSGRLRLNVCFNFLRNEK